MKEFEELLQKSHWKTEKHIPVIEIGGIPRENEFFSVNVGVGKEIDHTNKTEHHIAWIQVFFLPKGSKYPYKIGEG